MAAVNENVDQMHKTKMTCTQNRECGSGNTCKGAGTCSGGSRAGRSCLASGDCFGGTCTNIQTDIGTTVTSCTAQSQCQTRGIKVCSESATTGCPDVNAGGRRFLGLNGNRQKVADLTVRGFFEGVSSSGSYNEINNVTFERQCDDSVTTSGLGNVVTGGTISKGCDKCSQDGAGPAIPSNCFGRDCFHVSYDGVAFQGCGKPMRSSQPEGQGIRMHVKGVNVTTLSGFKCIGSEFDARDADVLIEGAVVNGCENGWIFGGRDSVHLLAGASYVTGAVDRGIIAQGSPSAGSGAAVKVRGSVIQNNGGGNAGPPRGGVTVTALGTLDLGTDSDPGNNKICRNTVSGSTNRDVHIHRDNTHVPAEWNYWRSNGGNPAVLIKSPASGQTQSTISHVSRWNNANDPVPGVGSACQ